MDREPMYLYFPVKSILSFPPVAEILCRHIPELSAKAVCDAMSPGLTLPDLREQFGISEDGYLTLLSELSAWKQAYDARNQAEIAEFGVEVDTDAPCHQWSNTDEHIQEACVRAIEEKYAGRTGEIIFYGPSNLQMWYSLEKDMLPYAAQNHGMGGCVDEEMIRYAPRMLYAFAPYAVFFQTGSNDLANGFTLEQILENKRVMYALYLENMPDTRLVVMSGLPLPGRQQYWQDTVKTNVLLQQLCENTDRMYFMDATDVMLSSAGDDNMRTFDGRYFRPEYYRADGIHLNKLGHDVWTREMKKILKQLV